MAVFCVIVAPPIAQAEPTTTPATSGTICFSANADGNWDLFCCTPDGQKLRRLTQTPIDERSCRLSPDGRRIAFSTSTGKLGLYDLTANAAWMLNLPPGPYDHPCWYPEGRRLLVARYEITAQREDAELCSYDLTTRKIAIEIRQTGIQSRASISRSGRIAYVSTVIAALRKGRQTAHQTLWVADDQSARPLHGAGHDPSGADRPAWSPDGRVLAFLGHDGRQWSVYAIQDSAGSSPARLAEGVARSAGFCWSPDGKELLFCRDSQPGVLFRLTLATRHAESIRPFGDQAVPIADPDWR